MNLSDKSTWPQRMFESGTWVGIDLDMTLAYYDGYRGHEHIGAPVESVVNFVRELITLGVVVKLFTARVGPTHSAWEKAKFLEAWDLWSTEQFGSFLEVTCTKDAKCSAIFDDRAYHIVPNKGVFHHAVHAELMQNYLDAQLSLHNANMQITNLVSLTELLKEELIKAQSANPKEAKLQP